jgi:hypothetical protein
LLCCFQLLNIIIFNQKSWSWVQFWFTTFAPCKISTCHSSSSRTPFFANWLVHSKHSTSTGSHHQVLCNLSSPYPQKSVSIAYFHLVCSITCIFYCWFHSINSPFNFNFFNLIVTTTPLYRFACIYTFILLFLYYIYFYHFAFNLFSISV